MYGLTSTDIQFIINLLKSYPAVQEGIMFGSRAMGNYKPGSDVDIALKGENLENVVLEISAVLNERSPLPYFFDVVDYHSLTNTQLIDHINRLGKTFYTA